MDRDQVRQLAADVQAATGETVEIAFVDQGYTGETPMVHAAAEGVRLGVVKLPRAERGVRAVAAAMGRGTELRLDGSLPSSGSRLRKSQ